MTLRYGRFAVPDTKARYGRIDGFTVRLFDGPPWRGGKETDDTLPLAACDRVCPVAPTKIVCVGRNYGAHIEEIGGSEFPKEPILCLKPTSSLLEPGGTIRLPRESERVEHDIELGVVIGHRCRRVPVAHALDQVFGYTVVGDITARDLQKRDGQWARSKGFDSFCPVGPEIVAGINPNALSLHARVNGVERQAGNTRDMVFSVAEIVSFVSQTMTLEPGDLISTGTPDGVGILAEGDMLEMEIEHIGVLRVAVRKERV